jgi:hypothetical protein
MSSVKPKGKRNTNVFLVDMPLRPQILGDRIPPFFVKNKFPVFFLLFGIFVINLCYIIREISLFHIIPLIELQMERLASEFRLNSRTKSPFMTEKQVDSNR